jgi:hypothetical protein
MKKLLLLPIIAAVSACAQFHTHNHANMAYAGASMTRFSSMLAASAQRASLAQQHVAALQQEQEPEVNLPTPPKITTGPFAVRQAFHWNGNFEQGVKALATYVGVPVHVVGQAPSVPIQIYVNTNHQTVLHTLYEIGLQTGNQAGVSPDIQNNTITIVYGKPPVSASNPAWESQSGIQGHQGYDLNSQGQFKQPARQ